MLASLILEQFGGPQGELAAAMRYFTQGISEIDPGCKDMLAKPAAQALAINISTAPARSRHVKKLGWGT